MSSSDELFRPRNEALAVTRPSCADEYLESISSVLSRHCAVLSIMLSGSSPSTDFVLSKQLHDTTTRMPDDATARTVASGW